MDRIRETAMDGYTGRWLTGDLPERNVGDRIARREPGAHAWDGNVGFWRCLDVALPVEVVQEERS